MTSIRLNIKLFILTIFAILALLGASFYLAEIDTDINRFLPRKDPVLSDAATIFKHHPIQGEMAIDIGAEKADPDLLVKCAQFVEARLKESGLFNRVGTESVQRLVPGLFNHIADNLPVLFTRQELIDQVLPLLSPDRIHRQIAAIQDQLLHLDAIGQSGFIARDPLALRHLIMAKLSHLAPSGKIAIYKGKLLSEDKQHLLVVATPAHSGTDTAFAKKLQALMKDISLSLAKEFGSSNSAALTPVGAYRAALDNETIARRDVKKAIILATIGIALLLIFAFPRPVLGLFAFLPAVAGTVAAFFVLSLFHRTISIMALGFGGAIISITVDHGIAYLLFLDRSRTAYGWEASSEIWAIGLMAALTTVGAFAALCLTDFPIFVQLGQFTAFGIAFSFLFIHFVFPKIFPELPPANVRTLHFRRGVEKLPAFGIKTALMAIVFAVVMGFFASPKFNVDLSAMNTVTRSTAAAEELMTRVWGSSIFSKIYMMTKGKTFGDLQKTGDQVLEKAMADMAEGGLESGFIPAMVFPGEERSRQNLKDWQSFWTPERIEKTRHALIFASKGGFTEDAFMPFYDMISGKTLPGHNLRMPEKYHSLMGIVQQPNGEWMQFAAFTPGKDYRPEEFYQRYSPIARIFDPNYFSARLGNLLFYSFMKMVFVIGGCVAVLLFIFFLDLKLTIITLTPVAFALVSTLGTMNLVGKSLDIPAIMLAIVVLGMGVDYSLFLVRARQRYGGMDHSGYERIRLAVMLASTSTLIGFGVLCLADHALLRSAGVTSFLGISYSLIGAFVILPPLLNHHFRPKKKKNDASRTWRRRILDRYKPLEPYPRLFSRVKTKTDTMFLELPRFLNGDRDLRTVIDIGCGYGVPGCWVLERFPMARVYGIDPNRERVRVAGLVFGDRGEVVCGAAPDIPNAPEKADAAFLLDIIHFLNDDALSRTFERLRKVVQTDAMLLIRAVVLPVDKNYSRSWKWDAFRMKLTGITAFHRPVYVIDEMLQKAGFEMQQSELSGDNEESVWIIATVSGSNEQQNIE
jgi:uncharacterized protein